MSAEPAVPSMRLDGRRALVTGAGRGIGLAAALALADAGAAVTLVARNLSQVNKAVARIQAMGGSGEGFCLDVTYIAAVRSFFEDRPAFDILVNNAGTNRPKPFTEVTEEDYQAVVDLNLKAALFVAQSAAKRMLEDRVAGSLVHIGSQMGHVGAANRALYCASKWGLEGLNKVLAIELASAGIRSNIVAPTFVETPMTASFLADEEFRREVLAKIKIGRLAKVDDIIGGILFLASDASLMITGTSLVIDGGWTAD